MLSSIVFSSVVFLYLVKYGTCDDLVAREPTIVYRPGSSSMCPPRAVCADDFTYRQKTNGVTYIKRRRLFNCRCDATSREVCPISDETMLYASAKNKQYLCRPISTLPTCNTQENSTHIAEELVQNSPSFEYRNYYRINCVCPRHLTPMPHIPGTLQRATKYRKTETDIISFRILQQYICAV